MLRPPRIDAAHDAGLICVNTSPIEEQTVVETEHDFLASFDLTPRFLELLMNSNSLRLALIAVGTAAFACIAPPAMAVDGPAAEALVKKSNCMKCHSVSAKKEGPSFKETAAKYKGKSEGEQKIVTHLTTNPKIKVDGNEEEHVNLKTKNEADVQNVAQWILSQ